MPHRYSFLVHDEGEIPGFYRDPRNAARPTRARFEYQDACVALRCIPNLTSGSGLRAVLLEWSTDYVLVYDDDRVELVSVKHRDPGQGDWSFAKLKAENIFRDLRTIWAAMDERGDYVFESNAGCNETLNEYKVHPPDPAATSAIASLLEVPVNEAYRFLTSFFLRQEVLPNRTHIEAVATEEMRAVLETMGLDPNTARDCFEALAARFAEVSTDRPAHGHERVARLIGGIRSLDAPKPTGQYIPISALRELVEEESRRAAARMAAAAATRTLANLIPASRAEMLGQLDEFFESVEFVPRFLVPATDDEHGDQDNAFAPGWEPEQIASDAGVLALDEVPVTSSLVILGEPGMGKTAALGQLARSWVETGQLHAVICIDLELVQDIEGFEHFVARQIKDEALLWTMESERRAKTPRSTSSSFVEPISAVDTTVPNPPAMVDHAASSAGKQVEPLARRVLVIMDHLDRCGLTPKQLNVLLRELLKGANLDRLCLVAACRTTDWVGGREPGLSILLPDPKVLRLTPLRPSDVGQLAERSGHDPESFRAAINAAGAMPLAAIPMTALLLLRLYLADTTLPSNVADLFERGLRLLAAEPAQAWGKTRQLNGLPSLSATERVTIAGRIAAWTQLCGFASVLCDEMVDCEPTDLAAGDLIGGAEPTLSGGAIAAARPSIDDTLACGLFTTRGPARRRIRHHTFAAFLAARYMVAHGMVEAQLHDVLLSPAVAGQKIFPQLREVAAWLVALDPESHRWLVTADAETIASYPYALAKDQIKPLLVDGLLQLADTDALRNRSLSALRIDRLDHPGLVEQLRAAHASGTTERRRAAIMIAEAAGATALIDDLIDIAVNTEEPDTLRVRAVLAVSTLGRDRIGERLRPLVVEPDQEICDELRGALLDALWPQALTAGELASALTPEASEHVTGVYTVFRFYLVDKLKDEDLPALLGWAAGHNSSGHAPQPARSRDRRTNELTYRLIARAWRAQDRAPLLPALAILIHDQLLNDSHLVLPEQLANSTTSEQNDRRALLDMLVDLVVTANDLARLVHSRFAQALGLLRRDDFAWLLEWEQAADDETAPRWHQLIRATFNSADAGHQAMAVERQGSRVWNKVFGPRLADPIPLGVVTLLDRAPDSDATGAPSDVERTAQREQNLDELTDLLQHSQQNNAEAFWQLCWRMQIDPVTWSIGTWWSDDVTARPGYKALAAVEPELHTLFLSVSEAYLLNHHPHTDEWIDSANVINWPAQAGYLAFAFLDSHAPDRMRALPAHVWETWAPALLWFDATAVDAGDPDRKRRLLEILGHQAPQAVPEPTVSSFHLERAGGWPCL